MSLVKDSICGVDWWIEGAEGARRHAVLLRAHAHARTTAAQLSAHASSFFFFSKEKNAINMPISPDQEIMERKCVRKFHLLPIRRFDSDIMKCS